MSIDEIDQFLGYTPHQLAGIPSDMQMRNHYASIGFSFDSYSVMFINDEGGYMKYSFLRYVDTDLAAYKFEQDSKGTEYKIGNQLIYYSNNFGDNVFVWFDGLDCYSLNGSLPFATMKDILEATIKNVEE